ATTTLARGQGNDFGTTNGTIYSLAVATGEFDGSGHDSIALTVLVAGNGVLLYTFAAASDLSNLPVKNNGQAFTVNFNSGGEALPYWRRVAIAAAPFVPLQPASADQVAVVFQHSYGYGEQQLVSLFSLANSNLTPHTLVDAWQINFTQDQYANYVSAA